MTRRAVGTAQRVWAWPFDTIPSDWTNGGGTPTETIVAFDGKHNVYQGAGQAWRIFPLNIKFEPTWLYRIRVRMRRTATSDNTKQFVFVGVEGVADDGVTLVNITGQDSFASQHYFGASAQDASAWPLNEWREIVGYFRGWAFQGSGQSVDPLNPGFMHANVRYFRPLFIVNYNSGPAGNVMQVGDFVVEAIVGTATDQPAPFPAVPTEAEFVHLIEANFSGGSLYLNTGARDIYWNGRTWDAIGGLLTFDAVQESGEDRGRGVAFQLAGVDQIIVATLLNNNYRGRVVRVYRAYLDPASGQVIDPDDRGIRIGATVARYAFRNPVASWPTTAMTIEAWIRKDVSDAGVFRSFFSYARPTVQFNEIILAENASTGVFIFQISGVEVDSPGSAIPNDGQWHHVAATWLSSGGATVLYVDGAQVLSTTLQNGYSIVGGGGIVLGQEQDALIGGFDVNQAWVGEIDRVRVYNRVLTASEVAEHALGTILDKTGLLAEWSFDDPGNMGRDGSPNTGTPNDLTPVGISVPSEGSPITKVLLLFEGLQVAPYEIEENRDRSTGTVVIKMQAVGYLGVEKIRGIDANVTSHQHIYAGDTFFQNVASLANLHIYWGTSAPTPIGGGMQGGGAASGGSGGGGPSGKT